MEPSFFTISAYLASLEGLWDNLNMIPNMGRNHSSISGWVVWGETPSLSLANVKEQSLAEIWRSDTKRRNAEEEFEDCWDYKPMQRYEMKYAENVTLKRKRQSGLNLQLINGIFHVLWRVKADRLLDQTLVWPIKTCTAACTPQLWTGCESRVSLRNSSLKMMMTALMMIMIILMISVPSAPKITPQIRSPP